MEYLVLAIFSTVGIAVGYLLRKQNSTIRALKAGAHGVSDIHALNNRADAILKLVRELTERFEQFVEFQAGVQIKLSETSRLDGVTADELRTDVADTSTRMAEFQRDLSLVEDDVRRLLVESPVDRL